MTTLTDQGRPTLVASVLVILVAVLLGAATVVLPLWAGLAVLVLVASVGLLQLTLIRFDYMALAMLSGRAALDLTHTPGASVLRPSVVVTLVFALVAFTWLLSRYKLGLLRLSPVAWAALAMALSATLSVVFSPLPAQAAQGALRFWIIAVMFCTFEHLARERGVTPRLAAGILVGSIVPLLVGLGQLARGVGRLEGSLSHPNTFGFFLTVMLIIAISITPSVSGRVRVPLIGLTALIGLELLLTYSRSSYLALLVAGIAMAVVSRKYWMLPVIALAVAGSLLIPSVQARLEDLSADRNLSGTAGNSLVWRTDYWQTLAATGGRRTRHRGRQQHHQHPQLQRQAGTQRHREGLRGNRLRRAGGVPGIPRRAVGDGLATHPAAARCGLGTIPHHRCRRHPHGVQCRQHGEQHHPAAGVAVVLHGLHGGSVRVGVGGAGAAAVEGRSDGGAGAGVPGPAVLETGRLEAGAVQVVGPLDLGNAERRQVPLDHLRVAKPPGSPRLGDGA